ncbi:MAG: MaoC family dehydratase [Acidimicrobiales bacterium]
MATHFDGIESMKARVGQHLGYSDWHQVTQDQVNLFAEATGDHQWIHVDPERAKVESPFGGTIAHGYLTLSLAPALLSQVYSVSGVSMGLNYGCNKVRFPAPVPVGSKLRLGATLKSIDEIAGGAQVVMALSFELEGQEKPSCVADAVYRFYL